MSSSSLKFKLHLVQILISNVSEDSLDPTLPSVSSGEVLLPATLQPLNLVFLLSFPHLIPSLETAPISSLWSTTHLQCMWTDVIKGRELRRRWYSRAEWPNLDFDISELKNPWSILSYGEITLYFFLMGCSLLALSWVPLGVTAGPYGIHVNI